MIRYEVYKPDDDEKVYLDLVRDIPSGNIRIVAWHQGWGTDRHQDIAEFVNGASGLVLRLHTIDEDSLSDLGIRSDDRNQILVTKDRP
ncbi:MAG: hypothetical protein FJX72_21575 [Armatimonadetes bacterium]|nr:hypothetical protein [Armatimonadota bacterium]